MATDEELKRHVRQVERGSGESGETELASRLDDLESTARCVHNELAHRIETAEAQSARAAELQELREKVVEVEQRLEALETEVP